VSQLAGISVVAIAALFFLKRFGLMGMAFAVLISACSQLLALVSMAAKWLKVSPLEFWPFRAGNVRLFWHQVAGLRLRYSRSPA
jgi:hypothetical protein